MTEQLFLWRFITPLEMTTLYDRVIEVLLPNPLDRVGVSGLMHEKVHLIATTLRPMRVEWHDPMGEAMRLRGEVAERLFREFIAVLSARNASYLTPQTPRKLAKHAGPDRLFTMTEVRHMFSSPAGALAAFNTAAPPNPGVVTRAATQPCPPTKPFAALAPALGQSGSQPQGISPSRHFRTRPRRHRVSTVFLSSFGQQQPLREPFHHQPRAPPLQRLLPPRRGLRRRHRGETSSTTFELRGCVSRTLSRATAAAGAAACGSTNLSRRLCTKRWLRLAGRAATPLAVASPR